MTNSTLINKLISGCLGLLLSLASLSLQAEQQLRLSADELQKQLISPGLVVIDSRDPAAYRQSHIPGAVNLPEAITFHNKAVNGRITQPAEMQNHLRRLGLDTHQQVVVYDNGDMISASRVFWTLEVYGFNQVKVLDKGFLNWLQKRFPVSSETPAVTPSSYVPMINHQRLATKLTTQVASKNPNQVVIDARGADAYKGLKSSAKRFGHIPSAINIPGNHNLSEGEQMNALRTADELRALYADFPKSRKIVIYCTAGRISSASYLALRELGYNVANYDAAWKEWGNDFSLPIEK